MVQEALGWAKRLYPEEGKTLKVNAVELKEPLGLLDLCAGMLAPQYAARATEEALYGRRGVTITTAKGVSHPLSHPLQANASPTCTTANAMSHPLSHPLQANASPTCTTAKWVSHPLSHSLQPNASPTSTTAKGTSHLLRHSPQPNASSTCTTGKESDHHLQSQASPTCLLCEGPGPDAEMEGLVTA